MQYRLKSISPDIRGRWLDIGAGDAPYRKYFANADEYLTTNTKRHYSTQDIAGLNKLTSFWIEDGKNLPLPDHSLDGVACFQVLSVIDKPEEFFAEVNRVLKPGGKFLLTTDFIYPVWSSEDRMRHTAFDLKKLSENIGFENIETESFGGFGSTVYALFMRYMRSFTEIWKQKKPFAKLISAIPYLVLLFLLPIISLKGSIIFMIERNNKLNTDFTFNILLSATKKK